MSLRLHEELLLLALHDQRGTNAFTALLAQGLGGALFAELLLEGRVEIRDEGKRRLVTVVDSRHTGDAVIDEALERLQRAKRRADPPTTVTRLTSIKQLKHKVARALCHRGVLRTAEDQILLLFRRRVYPTVDPGPERALVQRIREALESEGQVDERTAILIGLADATSALSSIYSGRERRALKSKLAALRDGTEAGKATFEAIQAVRAALVATTTVTG